MAAQTLTLALGVCPRAWGWPAQGSVAIAGQRQASEWSLGRRRLQGSEPRGAQAEAGGLQLPLGLHSNVGPTPPSSVPTSRYGRVTRVAHSSGAGPEAGHSLLALLSLWEAGAVGSRGQSSLLTSSFPLHFMSLSTPGPSVFKCKMRA